MFTESARRKIPVIAGSFGQKMPNLCVGHFESFSKSITFPLRVLTESAKLKNHELVEYLTNMLLFISHCEDGKRKQSIMSSLIAFTSSAKCKIPDASESFGQEV